VLEDRSLPALLTLTGAGITLQPTALIGSVLSVLPVLNGGTPVTTPGVTLTNPLPVTSPVVNSGLPITIAGVTPTNPLPATLPVVNSVLPVNVSGVTPMNPVPVAPGGTPVTPPVVTPTNPKPVTLPAPVPTNIPQPSPGPVTLPVSSSPTPPASQGPTTGGTAVANPTPAVGGPTLPTDLTRTAAVSGTLRPPAPVVAAGAVEAPRNEVAATPTLSVTATYLLAPPGALAGVLFGAFTSSGAGSAGAGGAAPAAADPGRTGDLRPEAGAGAAAASASAGFGDELLEAFFPAPPEPDLLPEHESLGNDLAAALLTGGTPRPDLLPQQGSQVSPVATLLPGDGADRGRPRRTGAGAADEGLSGLLIGPVLQGGAGPAGSNWLAPLSAQPTSADGPAAPGDRRLRAVLMGGTVVMGLAVQAARERGRRRAEAEPETPRGGRPAGDLLPGA
jgi:hypothetical protein